MARGWESKSVEDQIAAAEQPSSARPAPPSSEDLARRSRVAILNVSRSRILQDLQTACDRRYRAMLEQALADVDAALRLEAQPPGRAL